MGLIGAGLLTAQTSRKPNIVFLLSDDVGIDLIGCYGSDRYKTPNIDALAKGGTRFENCYAAPLCGPSRTLIQTGRYAFRTGGLTNQSWRAGGPGTQSKDEVPVAKVLKQAGYATCAAGKWRQVGETPGDWGFDEYVTDPTAGGWYWEKDYTRNGKLVDMPKDAYGPDVYHDFAMDFMRRNSAKPFYIYYSTHLVHGPILRTPDTVGEGKDLYADNIAYLDKLVGKVVSEVDRLGLRNDTVIVFSGDNGTARQSFTVRGRQINGQKGTMMEGGSRVPLIVNWKGKTPAGKVVPDLTDFTDFYSTFAELADAPLPSGVKIDSRSFAPQIRGLKGTPRDWVYVQLGRNYYVKDRGWKLTQGGELFDMKEAPFEEKLVATEGAPADAVQARKRLQAVLDDLNPNGGKTDNATAADRQAKKANRMKKK